MIETSTDYLVGGEAKRTTGRLPSSGSPASLPSPSLKSDLPAWAGKPFRRSIVEILSDFDKPIPDRFIKSKPIKGQKIYYVSWYSLVKILDFYSPGFDWQIRTTVGNDRTIVEGKLTIKALEGDFVREATGQESSEIDSYGDPSSNAEAMALRRCCAKFGLGLHLWEKS